ncbi:hypothetical protein [Shewanella khirikhana]|uniref:Uncharacterized protein n=1 Tax=Shewanella khirikhana TaxID=1965282 RepID=A0ABN5TTB2_9GAMM|nr:hypothetical protein [Shewanella khirikhana]AZQ09390.1 hypothetical protein STH12_00238 [Shewanella khirikhana]
MRYFILLAALSFNTWAATDDQTLIEVFKPRCDQVMLDLKAKDEQAIFDRLSNAAVMERREISQENGRS